MKGKHNQCPGVCLGFWSWIAWALDMDLLKGTCDTTRSGTPSHNPSALVQAGSITPVVRPLSSPRMVKYDTGAKKLSQQTVVFGTRYGRYCRKPLFCETRYKCVPSGRTNVRQEMEPGAL
jgi:hypothetical protein